LASSSGHHQSFFVDGWLPPQATTNPFLSMVGLPILATLVNTLKINVYYLMSEDFNNLITWSKQFNHLPWRQNRTPYVTLVSEIMLQQTTVATVHSKFEGFIKLYPSISKLAKATEQEILVAWKGLGYYRRAKNLLAAAKFIESNYHGIIPTDYNQLIAIPGIGDYTACAILAIGYNQKAIAIDTNLERVLARYYDLDIEKGTKLKSTILNLFENKKIFNTTLSFRELNEALMDLGREYCVSTKVNCCACPLKPSCKSKDNPLARPVVKNKQRISHDLSLLRVLIIEDNKLWCYQKSANEWLSSQWECPTFVIKGSEPIQQYPILTLSVNHKNLQFFKTNITKYKITNYILSLTIEDFKTLFLWERELHKLAIANNNFSTATQKAINLITKDRINIHV
jgi:A/G-specific adenine glycosylase